MSSTTKPEPHWTAKRVRETFIEFFEKRGHEHVPSSSTIPYEDPTLLFTNAGMNQFKAIFLSQADPKSHFGQLKRAISMQKCIRAGGKHNDLEDVGKDTYHHTFFEMMGNWSFGDYFKKEAISWSWELLTSTYGLEKDRLYVTYFQGDESQGLLPDDEAKEIWRDIVGVPESNIVKGNMKDNFWAEMGATGPCGPCSEIHYDLVGNRDAAAFVNSDDHPEVLEIWNNVFIQYNRQADGSLKDLPAKHVDTGMGYERLVSVLQGKTSNYDTEIFGGLFAEIFKLSGKVGAYEGRMGEKDLGNRDMGYRLVADHVRTLSFAIGDGQLPSNEGRGYVLRKIFRRADRYAKNVFKIEDGQKFWDDLIAYFVKEMSPYYPALTEQLPTIQSVLRTEESLFRLVLSRGEKLFSQLSESHPKTIPGKEIWRIFETFGFPIDLMGLLAEEKGVGIDWEGYEREKAKSVEENQRRAKKTEKEGDTVELTGDHLKVLTEEKGVKRTDDNAKYAQGSITGTITALFQDGAFHETSNGFKKSSNFGILLDKTNFYAEQGGQEWDHGVLSTPDGKTRFKVDKVKLFKGYVLHVGYLLEDESVVTVGQDLVCSIDDERRSNIERNHTGTHILNFALRKHVGGHVDQKGSLVAPEKLRFDFNNPGPVNPSELEKVGTTSNEWITKNVPVFSENVDLETAKKIPGVRKVFGENYPDPVRVVSLEVDGKTLLNNLDDQKWWNTSIEFCGGTHVQRTGDIELLVLTDEFGIAKGIRRIIAITGDLAVKAEALAADLETRLQKIDALPIGEKEAAIKPFEIQVNQSEFSITRKYAIRDSISDIRKKIGEHMKQQEKLELQKALDTLTTYFDEKPNATFFVGQVDVGSNIKIVQQASKAFGEKGKAVYLFSPSSSDGKVYHANFVPKTAISPKFNAKLWTQEASKVLGGKGGGKDDTSQGVGLSIEKLPEALKSVTALYESNVQQ
ncbi:hypothetical protein BT69DRAFT_1245614 [Atractiella rhizophila]|nr:hypothetical protein BT69DRAFT_1245614 [Atractiella rhizophila]